MYKPPPRFWYAAIGAIAIALPVAALIFLTPKDETPVAAPTPTAIVTEAAVEPGQPAEPAPVEPTTAPEPEPSEANEPDAALPTLADAIRDAYPLAPDPGILFFEGEWLSWTLTSDDKVGQPGVYAGIVGRTTQKVVKFDGGTAIISQGNFDAPTNTTQLLISVTPE